MTQRDPLRRTSEPAKASATRPLAPPRTTPMGPGAELDRLIASADAVIARQAPRVAILARACREAGVAVPGTAPLPDPEAAPADPQAARVHAYLVAKLAADPVLARAAAVAIFRLEDARAARQAAAAARRPGQDPAPALAALKQKLYYVTRAAQGLQGDPMFAMLFPPPTTAEAPAPTVAPGRLRRHEHAERVEAFLARLAPRLEVAMRLAARAAKGPELLGLLDPTKRREALLVGQLAIDPPARAELAGLQADHVALRAMLAQALETGDMGPLAPAVTALSRRLRKAQERPAIAAVLGPSA